jgi:1,4-dihydroxy-2-naphthoate octaprenyltransferase
VVSLAAAPPEPPKAWVVAASAALGAAAHFLNTVPDLADDAATGVRGLPHRLGGPRSLRVAAALLMAATVAIVLGPPGAPTAAAWLALPLAAALAAGALTGHGQMPFRCGVAIALLNVILLVLTVRR